jgi:hypothetical protein
MAQISKGDTFTDGQQVTGARLNQLVDSSVLLVGAITDQPSITANTLEATDTTIVNDAGVLKEATIGDFLNSNLPITASSVTTSSITGGAGVDIAVTPAAGQKFDVAGAFEANSINSTGAVTAGGNLTVTGTSTLTGGIAGNLTVGGLVTGSGAPTTGEHLANKTYVDGTVSKATNGSVTLPNGLIIKWGFFSGNPVSSNITTSFSTAFPNSCVNVSVTLSTGYAAIQEGKALSLCVTSKTTSQFVVNAIGWNSASADGFYWMAIGY